MLRKSLAMAGLRRGWLGNNRTEGSMAGSGYIRTGR
jgi:hypothetical protein